MDSVITKLISLRCDKIVIFRGIISLNILHTFNTVELVSTTDKSHFFSISIVLMFSNCVILFIT